MKNVGKVSLEHKQTAADLELDERIFNTTPREAFVTLKDHKPDFQIRPSVRLINPTKHELGKVAMKILDDVVKQIRKKANLKQCTNTKEVINWFESVKNDAKLKFVLFDIVSFYPSITPALLNRALQWAMKYVNLTPQQVKIIHQASQSFLYSEGMPWVKKGEVKFDIGMG